MRRRAISCLTVALLFAFSLSVQTQAATGPPIDNEEQRVSEHGFRFGAHQFSPDVSGDRLVWQDHRGDSVTPQGNSLWYKDLSTRDESPVTTVATAFASPRISGDWIVWSDFVGGDNDIFARELPDGPIVQVTTNDATQINPVIDGTLVVWEDLRNGNVDIFKKDLSGGLESSVVTAAGNQSSPSVSGTVIAWRDARRGPDKADVYVRDGSDPEVEIRQVDGAAESFSPHRVAVAEDRLVWNEIDPSCVGGGCDKPRILRTCVLPCASTSIVDSVTGSGEQRSITGMDLSGSQAVWVKQSEESHVYTRDFATADPIATLDSTDGLVPLWPNARVEGTRVVWGEREDPLLPAHALEREAFDIFWRDLVAADPPMRANSIGLGNFGGHLSPGADDDLVAYRAPGVILPNDQGSGFLVWATDLSGERRHFEVSTVYGTDTSRPAIVGNRAAWSDDRHCRGDGWLTCQKEDVFERDPLDSGTEEQLSTPNGVSRTPDADGSTTVWRCEDTDICVHDGDSLDVIDVSGSLLHSTSFVGNIVRISGDVVLWHEFRFLDPGPSQARIHALDLVTEDDEVVGAGLDVAGEFPDFDIDGLAVVMAGGDGSIYRNTVTGCGGDGSSCDNSGVTLFEAPGVDRSLSSVSISGNRVAWVDASTGEGGPFGTTKILTRTLAEPDRHLVTNETSAHVESPFVDGDRIYWADFRNGEADIFMESVSGAALPQPDTTAPSPPSNFTATEGNTNIDLSWNNPSDDDFYKVRILRKSGPEPPSGLDDTSASVIYEGDDESFIDTDKAPGVKYSYAIFAFDLEPNFSFPRFASTAEIVQVIPVGETHSGFTTFVLLANPNDFPVTAELTFLTSTGPAGSPQAHIVAPGARRTIDVRASSGAVDSVATRVTSNGPIVAEGSVHKSGSLASMDVIASETSPTWILPEGVTHSGFATFIAIANPDETTATHVDIDYLTGTGPVDGSDSFPIPAGGRVTISVGGPLNLGGCACTADVSTFLTVPEGEPEVVAGLSVSKVSQGDLGMGGSLGTTSVADTWVVAEGVTHSLFHTFVLVSNPGLTSSTVNVRYLTGNQGGHQRVNPLIVPAQSRRTLDVNVELANLGLQPDDVSTVIDRISGPDVAVESSVQKQDDAFGFVIADSIGASGGNVAEASGESWIAAEGATHSGFVTFILVANPDPVNSAVVDLTFLTPEGEVAGPANQTILPGRRSTFAVNNYVPGKDVSTRVVADSGAVVVEMTIDRVVSGQGFIKARSLAFRL